MTGLPRAGLLTALAIFALDQVLKWLVLGPVGLGFEGDYRTLLPIFDVRFVKNPGVSLGLLHASTETMRWALVLLTAGIAIGVLIWMRRERNRIDQVALGGILGGAIGNIVDRIRYGYVVDYADLHFGGWRPFLVFNLADAAITVGVLVLVLRAFFVRETPKAEGTITETPNA